MENLSKKIPKFTKMSFFIKTFLILFNIEFIFNYKKFLSLKEFSKTENILCNYSNCFDCINDEVCIWNNKSCVNSNLR